MLSQHGFINTGPISVLPSVFGDSKTLQIIVSVLKHCYLFSPGVLETP